MAEPRRSLPIKHRFLILLRGRVGLLFSQPTDQLVVRSVGDHAVELRAEVVDHADVFYNDVVHPPLSADEVGFILRENSSPLPVTILLLTSA
jgi:hypothetical protein